MPEFQYLARDRTGGEHAGMIQAASKNLAASQLRERGWVVVAMEILAPSRGKGRRLLDRIPPRSIQVELSLQQMALMLRSGMTILAAIQAIVEQSSRVSLIRTWENVGAQIKRGHGLSQAMEAHSCFPAFVTRMIHVGEQTGNLDMVLSRAATTMRDRRTTRDSLISATIYPALVLLLSIAVTVYMVVYLIPRLEVYLQSLGKQMPAMTQGLIDASAWLRQNYLAMLVFATLLVVAGAVIYLSREGRVWIDRLLLRTPVLGRLIQLSESTTFARSLSMMLKSGITLSEALGAVKATLHNRFLAQQVSFVREKVIRGSNFVDALRQSRAFTPMLTQMVGVGEQSGEMSEVLTDVSDLHEVQFNALAKRINAFLTPTLTILIGGVVGYVYVAFFMALIAAGS